METRNGMQLEFTPALLPPPLHHPSTPRPAAQHPHSNAANGFSTQRILLGTHTSGQDQNYLQIAEVQLPLANEELDQGKYDDDRGGE